MLTHVRIKNFIIFKKLFNFFFVLKIYLLYLFFLFMSIIKSKHLKFKKKRFIGILYYTKLTNTYLLYKHTYTILFLLVLKSILLFFILFFVHRCLNVTDLFIIFMVLLFFVFYHKVFFQYLYPTPP